MTVSPTGLSKPHRHSAAGSLRRLWSNTRVRRFVWQALAVLLLIGTLAWLVGNLRYNLATRNIGTGLGFLHREAGLPIAEFVIEYSPADTYFRALLVGTLNTLWVTFLGIVIATILGVVIGVARLSQNWLLAKLTSAYVEFFRGLPLLLQILLWYSILQRLPPVRQALHPIGGVYLSNRGLTLPTLDWDTAHSWVLSACLAGVVATIALARRAGRLRLEDGRVRKVWPYGVGLVLGLPILVALALGAPFAIDWPLPRGFNISGGITVSPELFALVLALAIYNAAFVAEIVRSGIMSVGRGQIEAASALGLNPRNTLVWIIFPQALRVIVPPLTSQYLNLLKGSSLAVAIGYQDLVSIANTAMNQTGQAIELVAIIMAVYLTFSLTISFFMNMYNARVALVGR